METDYRNETWLAIMKFAIHNRRRDPLFHPIGESKDPLITKCPPDFLLDVIRQLQELENGGYIETKILASRRRGSSGRMVVVRRSLEDASEIGEILVRGTHIGAQYLAQRNE